MSDTVIEHDNIAEAIVAFQAEVGTVAKDADNPFFKSKYADLPAVKAAAQPILAKHGLAVIQAPSYQVLGDKVYDTLRTTIIHRKGALGDLLMSEMILKPVKNDPQAQGSAITYARRYAFMAMLGLVADEDDDGNAASALPRPFKPKQPDEVQVAVAAVQAAVQAAGVSPADATTYFRETHNEDSLVKSRNVKALNETAEHYRVIATVKDNLGAIEAS